MIAESKHREDDPRTLQGDRFLKLLYAGLAATEVVVGVFNLADGQTGDGISSLAFGFVWITFLWQRRFWHRMGFRRGRNAAITSALEARQRGIDLDHWIFAEMEREIGVSIVPYTDNPS